MSTATPPKTKWAKRVIVGWALFLGALGAWGWGWESPVAAGASLFGCAMMLNASHQLRDAEQNGSRRSLLIWGITLLLFGSWSGYSAHHAVVPEAAISGIESAFLIAFFTGTTLIDPFLMWAVADAENVSTTQRPSVAGSQPLPADPVGHSATVVDFPASGGRTSATLAAAVAGVAGLSASGSAMAAELQPPAIHEPPGRVIDASPQAHAERLLRSGVSQRMVAERTKLTRYQIGQLAKSIKEEVAA